MDSTIAPIAMDTVTPIQTFPTTTTEAVVSSHGYMTGNHTKCTTKAILEGTVSDLSHPNQIKVHSKVM